METLQKHDPRSEDEKSHINSELVEHHEAKKSLEDELANQEIGQGLEYEERESFKPLVIDVKIPETKWRLNSYLHGEGINNNNKRGLETILASTNPNLAKLLEENRFGSTGDASINAANLYLRDGATSSHDDVRRGFHSKEEAVAKIKDAFASYEEVSVDDNGEITVTIPENDIKIEAFRAYTHRNRDHLRVNINGQWMGGFSNAVKDDVDSWAKFLNESFDIESEQANDVAKRIVSVMESEEHYLNFEV